MESRTLTSGTTHHHYYSLQFIIITHHHYSPTYRLFLDRLFEQCPYVKLIIATSEVLSMRYITVGCGIVEYSVPLGPLSLDSSLRLFAKLAPSLSTSLAKREFIAALQPQRHIRADGDMRLAARELLRQFGNGHPARIVYMVQKSTPEKVQQLMACGRGILEAYNGCADLQSVASNQSAPTVPSSVLA